MILLLLLFSDIEPPVFRNCPAEPVEVESYGTSAIVVFDMPIADDNSGMRPNITWQPNNFTLPYEVSKVKYFKSFPQEFLLSLKF